MTKPRTFQLGTKTALVDGLHAMCDNVLQKVYLHVTHVLTYGWRLRIRTEDKSGGRISREIMLRWCYGYQEQIARQNDVKSF